MDGRDLGKIKKQGFFTGTKANSFRFIFIGVVLGASILFGAIKVYLGPSPNSVYSKIEQLDRDYALRQERITEAEARRVLSIRKKKRDDEL